MKMYDGHSHLGTTSSGESNSVKQLVEEMLAYNISKIGISSLSGSSSEKQNELVFEAMKSYPENIVGYAFINPKSETAIEDIRLNVLERGMRGVKLMPWKHGYVADNTPQIYNVLKYCDEIGVHIQVHVGTSPLTTPYPWIRYAKMFPNLRFVFTHMGSREFGIQTLNAVRDLENVWLETSVQYHSEVLHNAREIVGSKRIVFGVDWPYKSIETEIRKIYLMGFNESELEDVFYKNIEQLWELKKGG